MNELFGQLDLSAWKPVLSALLLPPVPWLAAMVWGAWRLARRRRGGAVLVVAGATALWLTSTVGTGLWLARAGGLHPPALASERLQALAAAQAAARTSGANPGLAIVVLGGGREGWAPEYHTASLVGDTLQRLRYGLWLSRATGDVPVAFSGGYGWGQRSGPAEADIAARIAAEEFVRPLRWTENRSRDTRENARLTLPLLRADGVRHVLLVTHGWHMARALRAFRAEAGAGIEIEAAPLGLADSDDRAALDWIPSGSGLLRCRAALREWLGLRLGA